MPLEGKNVFVVLIDTGWREEDVGAFAAVDSVFSTLQEAERRYDVLSEKTTFWSDDITIMEMPVRHCNSEFERHLLLRPDGNVLQQGKNEYPLNRREKMKCKMR